MEATEAQGKAFGEALARELNGWSRERFAIAVEDTSGESVSVNAVRLWLAGTTEPTRAKVFAMEKVLGLPAGAMSQHLGYLPVEAVPSLTVEDAIRKDTSLAPAVRRFLLSSIEGERASRAGTDHAKRRP